MNKSLEISRQGSKRRQLSGGVLIFGAVSALSFLAPSGRVWADANSGDTSTSVETGEPPIPSDSVDMTTTTVVEVTPPVSTDTTVTDTIPSSEESSSTAVSEAPKSNCDSITPVTEIDPLTGQPVGISGDIIDPDDPTGSLVAVGVGIGCDTLPNTGSHSTETLTFDATILMFAGAALVRIANRQIGVNS